MPRGHLVYTNGGFHFVPPRPAILPPLFPSSSFVVALAAALTLSGCGAAPQDRVAAAPATIAASNVAAVAEIRPQVRLTGTIEAVRATTVLVPRLFGQSVNSLTITRLAKAGTRVNVGDVLVEFDPQDQERIASDRRAEVADLDGQIQRRRSDQAINTSRDDTELGVAEHNVERARFDTLNNRFLPRIDAERNDLALEAAQARFDQLKKTYALKRTAELADVKILEIRRERSDHAREYAEGNSRLMTVTATFAGIVVVKSTFKGSGTVDIQEGDQVRPGLPILDIVDPSEMRVRGRVNQSDISRVAPGLPATIRLDAYPELIFNGRVELVAPLAVASSLTGRVRSFGVVVSIRGNHPLLLPDLTASVDVGQLRGR